MLFMLSYSQGRELDVEEIDETEEDDRTKFKDQLQTIGSFGRQVCQSVRCKGRTGIIIITASGCKTEKGLHGGDALGWNLGGAWYKSQLGHQLS
jgi:hypothetical protein